MLVHREWASACSTTGGDQLSPLLPGPSNSAPEKMPQGGEGLMSTHTHAHSSRTRQICSRGTQTGRDPNAHPQCSGHTNGGPRQWSATGRGDSASYHCVPPLGASPRPAAQQKRPDAKDTHSFQSRAPRGHVRPILGDGGPGSGYRGAQTGGQREGALGRAET